MTRHHVRSIVVSAVVFACVYLAASVARVRRMSSPAPGVSAAAVAVSSFHTAIYNRDQLRVRFSGDLAEIFNPRFLGPFRLGFMRSLKARNVTIETFPIADAAAVSPGHAASLQGLSDLPLREWTGAQMDRAELAPVRVIEHRDGRERLVLQAAFCSARIGTPHIVCKQGVLEKDGVMTPFRNLAFDGKTVRTTQ